MEDGKRRDKNNACFFFLANYLRKIFVNKIKGLIIIKENKKCLPIPQLSRVKEDQKKHLRRFD